MGNNEIVVAYLVAGVLFIRSLGGLSQQETARRGNWYGVVGMAIATVATMLQPQVSSFNLIAAAVVVGAVIGGVFAKRVAMTAMPELVALLHSFVGLAAVLVGASTYLRPAEHALAPSAGPVDTKELVALWIHLIEVWIGVAVGAVTFTGSIIAWAKLRGMLSGKPLLIPGRHLINLALVSACVALFFEFVGTEDPMWGLDMMILMACFAGLLGAHLVMAIGGADMPVVVSLLNSYSGWAAAASGFALGNDLLIVTGALVGASGAILSIIMCRAMNRSILNVVFGGFGTADGAGTAAAHEEQGETQEIDTTGLVAALAGARKVVIVPGYGMAVARAQHPVHEMTTILRERGCEVKFAIHPVAGRLPGHMNVLLAEAGVPYDIVEEMEHINGDFPNVDVVLIIGANDIVNPGALTDTASPIYGMPVLEVWKSRLTVVLKRGMAAGYAGVENPLFFLENTRMLFGDAKKSVDALVAGLREG
jgi:NAD(P) transhydrogenase subunit beta